MTKSTKMINRGEQTGRLSHYLNEVREPLRFVIYYALFYGALRLIQFVSFKLFIGAGLPQVFAYASFLIAVTTGIMSQLLLDFAIFIAIGAAIVGVVYAIRLGVKWLMNRSDAAIDSIPSLPGSVTIYGTGPAVTFGERIERTPTKRKSKRK